MIGFGVPAGATGPIVCRFVRPGKPASATVASSGAAMSRSGLVTARIRSFPEWWNPSECTVTAMTAMATCPLIISPKCGFDWWCNGLPRYWRGCRYRVGTPTDRLSGADEQEIGALEQATLILPH